ncbi:DUF6461 domain-containing protein [Sphaerisporangium sp. NPDC005288]|uniref:DUF6461 domain-containing protein n=1 Tax=Sphaerisporangium sp. NPDC005288 TaxID=3155114 RepID=UPI0033A793F7
MSSADAQYSELLHAGLSRQLCLTWCQQRDLDEVARRFGADMETGLWATEDEIEELEEDDTAELVQLATIGAWTIAYEPGGYQGSRNIILESLSEGGRAFNVHWNVELDSSICYAVDGVTETAFELLDPERRSGAHPAALDDILAEVGLHQGLTTEQLKARVLALGKKISGQPLTPEWLRSPRYVFKISDALPDPLVPAAYRYPRAPFLDEPEFARILDDPSPAMASAVLRQVVSVVIAAASLEGPLPSKVMRIIDHGEQVQGERDALRSELSRQAGDIRAKMLRDAPDASERDRLDLAGQTLVVLRSALNASPAEAAGAASRAALGLSGLPREDFMRLLVLSNVSTRIERDLHRSNDRIASIDGA